MHRTEGLGHVANKFDPGDPMVPRRPTKLDHTILNAMQEEIAQVIEAADIPLRTMAGDVTASYASQLLEAIEKLNPVKAACTVSSDGSENLSIIGASRNVASVALVPAGGNTPQRIRVTFTTPVPNPITASVDLVRHPSVLTLPAANLEVRPVLQEIATTHVDFFVMSDDSLARVGNRPWRYAVVMIGKL